MEITEQIEKFHEFFDLVYKEQLHQAISKKEKFLVIDFIELNKYNTYLSKELLENPKDILRISEIAIEQFDFPGCNEFRIRFKNLPKTQEILIRDIRSKHYNKFIQLVGIVKEKLPIGVQIVSARFECPSCGNIITELQNNRKLVEPSKCGCKRKGKFKLLNTKVVDRQEIILTESLKDKHSPSISSVLVGDLINPSHEKKILLESEVVITGIINFELLHARDGGRLNNCNFNIDVNHIELVNPIGGNEY